MAERHRAAIELANDPGHQRTRARTTRLRAVGKGGTLGGWKTKQHHACQSVLLGLFKVVGLAVTFMQRLTNGVDRLESATHGSGYKAGEAEKRKRAGWMEEAWWLICRRWCRGEKNLW
jgi:hypothetical protein